MAFLLSYVDLTDSVFGVAVFFVAFNPLFWNTVARWEHRTRSLTHLFRSPYTACYSLGAVILLLNFLRSHCFAEAMKSQPKLQVLDSLPGYYAGAGLVAIGVVFVLSSFLALGFVGTFLGVPALPGILASSFFTARLGLFSAGVHSEYQLWKRMAGIEYIFTGVCLTAAPLAAFGEWVALDFSKRLQITPATPKLQIGVFQRGDYFGILMEAKVTCFPFSVLDNPMYWGSTSIYLGWAVMLASPAGLLLTAVVALCYTIALRYEGPFTEQIYRQKAAKSK